MNLKNEQMLLLYENMYKIRRFEERAGQVFAAGKIPGFLHTGIGQEAIAAGALMFLKPTDYIGYTHRGHGHCIAKGADLKLMFAELFGKETGYCKGKSGSMHIASPELGMLGANGIVGGGLPIVTGAALSAKCRKTDSVAVAIFGEGATSEGTFHESLNMSSLWKLPVIYICENNLYAEFTPKTTHMPNEFVAERVTGYKIPAVTINGNDVLEVYKAVNEAVERARIGEGPSFVECLTYRWSGHYEGDPMKYRPTGELEEWKKRDPIASFEKYLTGKKLATAEMLKEIRQNVEAVIEEGIKFAEESPDPSPDILLQDVYA